jgi:hypothetical protein
MSKIVRAANAMLANTNKITKVVQKGREYFFLYGDKHKWSILYLEGDDEYRLFYYPGDKPLEYFTSMDDSGWQYFSEYILYKTGDLGTKEAYRTFQELYMTVKEKIFGIDKVLDEIIADDKDIPF